MTNTLIDALEEQVDALEEQVMVPDHDGNIKKVLVAVDLSPHSERTVAYAANLAKVFGASLTLINVCSPDRAAQVTNQKDQRFDEPMVAPEVQLEQLAKRVRKIYPTCDAYLYVGDPTVKVAMIAEILHADLIVTGSHNPGFLDQLVGLDHARQILHRAPCPVLIYQERE
jgi:nucleotide-binding universal stress UspA family protein